MADWWADLENFFNWEQVAPGDRAIVAAIQALGQQLAAAHAAASGASEDLGLTAGASAPTAAAPPASGGLAGQWEVGYGGTATTIPLVSQSSRQAIALPEATRAGLVGAVLTFESGPLAGYSTRVLDVNAAGVLTPEGYLPLSPTAGDRVAITAAPSLTAPDQTGAWLDTWIQPGRNLTLASPWNGHVNLTAGTGGGPVHLAIGYGFAGSVSGTATASDLTMGANDSSTVALSSPSGLIAKVGAESSVTLSANSGVVNVTLDVGPAAASIISLSSGNYCTYAIGPASEGNYTLGGYGAAFAVGRNDSSVVHLTARYTSVTLGDAGASNVTAGVHNGRIEIGDGAACIANVSGYNCVVTIGAASADGVTLTGSADGATVRLGDSSQSTIHVGDSRLPYPVIRMGDSAVATVSADSSSTGAVGPSSWFDLYGQTKSLAAGSAYTTPDFNLTGWGPGNTAVAQVSGADPWELSASVQVASGGPSYSLGSATATAGATLTLADIPNVAGVTLTVKATGTAAVTVQDLGIVLTPPDR